MRQRRHHKLHVLVLGLYCSSCTCQVARFLSWAAADGFKVERVAPERIPKEYRVPDVLVVFLQLLPTAAAGQQAPTAACLGQSSAEAGQLPEAAVARRGGQGSGSNLCRDTLVCQQQRHEQQEQHAVAAVKGGS